MRAILDLIKPLTVRTFTVFGRFIRRQCVTQIKEAWNYLRIENHKKVKPDILSFAVRGLT